MKRLRVRWRDQAVNMSLPESGVLSAIVSVLDRGGKEVEADELLKLQLGGLDSTDGMHPHWGDYDLVPGDEVTISIHDDQSSDPPIERRGLTKDDRESQEKKYLRKTAAKFGWELIEQKPNDDQSGQKADSPAPAN